MRSLEWLSMARSAVEGVPREYRLISGLKLAVAFFGVDGKGSETEKIQATLAHWNGLVGEGRRGGGGGGRRDVGKWEFRRDGTMSLCILWMRRKWRRGN